MFYFILFRCSIDSEQRYSDQRSFQISLSLSADEKRDLPGGSADNIAGLPGGSVGLPVGEDDDQSWITTPASNDSQVGSDYNSTRVLPPE